MLRRVEAALAVLGAAMLALQPAQAQETDTGFDVVIKALKDLGDQVEAQTKPGSVDRAQGYRYVLRRLEMHNDAFLPETDAWHPDYRPLSDQAVQIRLRQSRCDLQHGQAARSLADLSPTGQSRHRALYHLPAVLDRRREVQYRRAARIEGPGARRQGQFRDRAGAGKHRKSCQFHQNGARAKLAVADPADDG